MLIQILDTNQSKHEADQLNWFKKICDTTATEFGMKKLNWLHTESINFECDVFVKLIDDSRVLIGYKNDINSDYPTEALRWVEIEMVGLTEFGVITQVLMATIGISYMRSVTGSISTDWIDIKTVLNQGSKGYCCSANWETLHTAMVMLHAKNAFSESIRITSSAMLLNESLRLNEIFQHVADLSKTHYFSEKCLNILNITNIRELSSTNIFLFINKDRSTQFLNIPYTFDASTSHKNIH